MAADRTLQRLIVIALLSGLGLCAAAGAEEQAAARESRAPEASAADAERAFQDVPDLEQAYIDAAPENRQDGLVVGELGVDGGKRDAILELAQEIADGQHGRFDSVLIAHRGKLVFESYYARGRVDLPHLQASNTKAYLSLAVGRAIQLGHLTSDDLDKPLVGFLKDLDPTKFVEGAETITLHKAMTMRSGLRISDEHMDEFQRNSDRLRGQGQVQAYLEHSAPISAESQRFRYQGFDAQLVMQVLDAVAPGTAEDFIKNEFLKIMGITEYRWRTDVSGLPTGHNGSSLTSRDMIKLGLLVAHDGVWNGEQVVPEAFIDTSTRMIIPTGDEDIFGGGHDVTNGGYGYYWWRADLRAGDKIYPSISAQGGGGQFIILIDELDLIVVATAHEREVRTLQTVAERILPAFAQ